MKYYKRIRDYIMSNGIILKHVAEKSGIPQKKFYRLLNGTTDMTLEEYEKICRDGLGLEPSYFFTKKFSENEKTKSA